MHAVAMPREASTVRLGSARANFAPPMTTPPKKQKKKGAKLSLLKKVWTPCASLALPAAAPASLLPEAGAPCDAGSRRAEADMAGEAMQEAMCDPSRRCGDVVADRWRLCALLGTGTYGAVYRAETLAEPQQPWAVKVLWKAGLDAEQLLLQRLEVDINRRLIAHATAERLPGAMHPHIIPMRHFHEDAHCLYLVMALHHGSDLYEAIQELGGLDVALVKHVFEQIGAAVAHAHDAGVFHRDLKPENVLVTQDWQCKLCDFGLSSVEEETAEFGCGSAPYMAPEARGEAVGADGRLCKTYRCREADIWSLGIVLLNLVFACNPWKVASPADPSFCAFLKDPTVLQKQFGLSSGFYRLLMHMFDLDPAHRPSLEMVRQTIRALPAFTVPALHDASHAIVLSSSPTDVPVVVSPSTALAERYDVADTDCSPLRASSRFAITPVPPPAAATSGLRRVEPAVDRMTAMMHHLQMAATASARSAILAF